MRAAPINVNINRHAAVRKLDRVVECNHGGNRSVISSPLLLALFLITFVYQSLGSHNNESQNQ
jgi:hypothetical protein